MGLKGILVFLFTLVITAFMLVPLTGDTGPGGSVYLFLLQWRAKR